MEIRLTLKSDATFGRGDGLAGIIDTEVEHDTTTGLPFLRGRTLKGLLVEECANIMFSLRRANPRAHDRLQTAASFLFGRPGSSLDVQARMEVGRAMLHPELREAVEASVSRKKISRLDVLDALTAIRRQTSIDDTTEAPAEGSLRSSRVLLRGTTLHAHIRFIGGPPAEALALLSACVWGLRRAGMRRNRGRGRLQAELFSRGEAVTKRHFEDFEALVNGDGEIKYQHADVTSEHSEETSRPSTSRQALREEPVVITYRITLEQPTLVTALQGDPNSGVAFDYLPGSALRGALIGHYLARNGSEPNGDLAATPKTRRLFFDGTVRFLNGYPHLPPEASGTGRSRRMLPLPSSWHRPKGKQEYARDFAESSPFSNDESPTEQWQPFRAPFGVVTENGAGKNILYHHSPARLVTVHNQRDRKMGRATRESGEVFRYDALGAGQTFDAAIVCFSEDEANTIASLLNEMDVVTLGGSRSVGYGRCRIHDVSVHNAGWHEAGNDELTLPDDRIVVTLLSSAIVRDETGQHVASVDAVKRVFAETLNVQLIEDSAFLRTEIVGGFNRKWGLPLPQVLAVRMGSVFIFSMQRSAAVEPDDLEAKLAALEWEGIGERRVDGFGRIAINRHTANKETQVKALKDMSISARPRVPEIKDKDNRALAERMVERMVRKKLDVALVKKVNRLARNVTAPSNSQLARLRMAFREALDSAPLRGRDRLRKWLNKLPQASRAQLKRDRMGRETLFEWLQKRAEAERLFDTHEINLPEIGDIRPQLDSDKLAYEYNLRLAHDTLALAAKRKN